MATNGAPPGSADKSLGEIVNDVSQKATLLVREEIELAKAEVSTKLKRIGRGAGFFVGAGVLLFFMVFTVLQFLGFGFANWFGLNIWVGFAMVSLVLLLIAGMLGFVGYRSMQKGAPPTPDLAIEEAKKTRAAIEEARR